MALQFYTISFMMSGSIKLKGHCKFVRNATIQLGYLQMGCVVRSCGWLLVCKLLQVQCGCQNCKSSEVGVK
jgi:hypothetical protein